MARENEEIARAFRSGDREAFGKLIDCYQERLYRLAYRVTGNADDALDVVQDAFVRIHRSRESWDGRAAFYSWAYRITTNMAIDHVRRRGRDRKARDHIIFDQGDALAQAPASIDPIEAADQRRLLRRVRNAIDELPPGQRAVIALRHYESLTLAQIAEIRGCAIGTVKSTLHQAVRKLRRALADELEPSLQGGGLGTRSQS